MNKVTKIIVFTVAAAIMVIIGVLRTSYDNYKASHPSPVITTTVLSEEVEEPENEKTLSTRKLENLGEYMTEVSGSEITADMLSDLEAETLTTLYNTYYKDKTLTVYDWHDATGYTLNAFLDKFGTKESIDKGNNGRDYFELGFTGDINFTETGYVMTHAYTKPNLVLDCIDETFQSEMKAVDIMLINNEFPYTDRGSPTVGKKYTFHSKPEHVKYLTEMGVDIVSLANNHTYDYGYDSFVDTISTLNDENIPFVGAGMNIEEASEPVSFIINGYKVSYLACSGVEYPVKTPVATENSEGIMGSYDNGELMVECIKKAKENSDFVIVYPHWGYENTTNLSNAQIANARKYIDAGASAVIGNHSHCLQGMEYYNGSPIIYSLGNFWFNTRDVYTGLLKLKYTGTDLEMTFVPGRQRGSETYYLKDAEERRKLYDTIEGYQPYNKVSIDDNGVVTPVS